MATRREWEIHEPEGISNRGIDLTGVRNIVEALLLASIGVPPALVSILVGAHQTRVGRTFEHMQVAFATDTIQPLGEHIAGQLTKELLLFWDGVDGRARGQGMLQFQPEYERSAMMQTYLSAMHQKQAEYLVSLVTAGILTPQTRASVQESCIFRVHGYHSAAPTPTLEPVPPIPSGPYNQRLAHPGSPPVIPSATPTPEPWVCPVAGPAPPPPP